MDFGGHFEKSALTVSSTTSIFADNQIPIPLCIRFPKIVVSQNP
jgi:hypothetical protein